MKKIVTFLLIGVMTLSLMACGKKSSTDTANTGSNNSTNTGSNNSQSETDSKKLTTLFI